MRVLRRLAVLLLCSVPVLAGAAPPPGANTPGTSARCLEPDASVQPPLEPALPLPALVSGRAAFFMTRFAQDGTPMRTLALGDPDARFPLMSSYKALVVRAALAGVNQGRWTLGTTFVTTVANRSIEAYPKGTNTLLTLADRSLRLSDNTAADLLQLAVGPQALSRDIAARSPCTTVLLTSKAIFASLAGLTGSVLGPERRAGAANYAALPWEQRLDAAARLMASAQTYSGPQVEAALARYYGTPGHEGAAYRPELELLLQNTGTVRAWTRLLTQVVTHSGLGAPQDAIYQRLMNQGCCRPAHPLLPTLSWAAKAGSGWRMLDLSGVIRLPDGTTIGYSYFNDHSDVQDSEAIERQIAPLVAWTEQNALLISRGCAKVEAKPAAQAR